MDRANELRERIARTLADDIGPALALDGTRIEIAGVSAGAVQLRLNGMCGCCPTSIMAVVVGIEQELQRRIPEIEYVEILP
jgi:Fe-S cluster biogenesis protein NfuA